MSSDGSQHGGSDSSSGGALDHFSVHPYHPFSDEEEVISWIQKPDVFDTDVFVDEFLLPRRFIDSKVLLAMNTKVLRLYIDSRDLLNKIYRADHAFHFYRIQDAGTLKLELFQKLLARRDGENGFVTLIGDIQRIGGEFFAPPPILWRYLYLLWFQCGDVAPAELDPLYQDAPPVLEVLQLVEPNIVNVLEVLKTEKVPKRMSRHWNEALEVLYLDLRALAVAFQCRREVEQLMHFPMLKNTKDLLDDLVEMNEVAKEIILYIEGIEDEEPYAMPSILKTAVDLLMKY